MSIFGPLETFVVFQWMRPENFFVKPKGFSVNFLQGICAFHGVINRITVSEFRPWTGHGRGLDCVVQNLYFIPFVSCWGFDAAVISADLFQFEGLKPTIGHRGDFEAVGQVFCVDIRYDGGLGIELRIENAAGLVKRRFLFLHQYPFADLKFSTWMKAKDAFFQAALFQV